MDLAIASRSASSGMAQKIVSRMIIGGSAGCRMMLALPRPAPPMVCTPLLVVLVNSSMLALVPGPADTDDTDATISAYGTPPFASFSATARDTAYTIGMVACPPQVIILTFGASRCSRRFAGGITAGPTAAGVRSIAAIPAAAYFGAAAACTYALVASNTRSGFSGCASNQSTPSWEVSRPNFRARANPSLSGSIPTIHRGSSQSERNNLYNRSVLILPDPTIATDAL